jgi:hypothetical protein
VLPAGATGVTGDSGRPEWPVDGWEPGGMEDTPLCASVERDLGLSFDELTTYVGGDAGLAVVDAPQITEAGA